MYAKLTGNILRPAQKRVTWQGHTVDNPTADMLLDLGYYPVTYTDPPADSTSGQHYEPHWEQGEAEIMQVWTLVDDQAEPDPEPTQEERIAALEEQQERTDTAVQDLIITMMGGE